MKKKFSFLTSIASILICCSCATYPVTKESLVAQLAAIDSTDLIPGTVRGPMGEEHNYLANPLDIVEGLEKEGSKRKLIIRPSLEIRVTENSGNRTIFYFDRIIVSDNTLTGVRSRFLSAISKSIPLEGISKIEIHDGKKSFVYITK